MAILLPALAATLCAAVPALANAPTQAICNACVDQYNKWDEDFLDPNTGTRGPNAIEYDFAGDVTTVIPSQITADAFTNVFEALHQWTPANGYNNGGFPGAGVAPNPTTVTYDPVAGITRVVESGAALPFPVPNPWPGPNWELDINGHYSYHSGLNQGPGNLTPTSIHWIWTNDDGSAQTMELDNLAVVWQGKFNNNKAPIAYAEIFVETKDEANGDWILAPYVVPGQGKKATFDLKNYGKTPMTIGLMGLVLGIPVPNNPDCIKDRTCPDNQKLLDQLSEKFAPPPGQDGSPFTPVRPPASPLKPGATYRFSAP